MRIMINDGLIVTGVVSPITVGSGLACLHNMIYWNSEPVDVNIPMPATMPRIDRVVLRINWEEQTIRIAHITGDEGANRPPVMVVSDKILDEALACCFIGLDGIIAIENKPSPAIEILPQHYWPSIENEPLDIPSQSMV